MRLATFCVASALVPYAFASLMDNVLAGRQTSNTEETYLQEVCFPNTTNPVPPCQEIINIQTACQPNGTTSLYLLAHAECMCGGSFFSDWLGCLNCDYVHGARSQQEVNEFNIIISSASNLLCTGTPTASFAAIFSSLSVVGAGAASGATIFSDQYPSNAAISLYYTATVSQGVGVITGSATAAITQVTSSASGSATTKTSSGAQTGGGTTSSKAGAASGGSSSGGSGSTSTSKAGAAPTGVMVGMLGAMAGGVIMAAL